MIRFTKLIIHLVWFIPFMLCNESVAGIEMSLDFWRQRIAEVRLLAENHIPQAQAEARHLQQSLPLNATASDQARLFNLLARIEMYMGNAGHAEELIIRAREAAEETDDKIGFIEVDLNTAFNAVNQGDMETLRNVVEDALLMLNGVDRPDLLAEVLLRAAMTSLHNSQFDDAVSASMRNLEVAKQSGDPLAYTYAEQGMAIIHHLHGRFEQARNHYVAMGEYARAAGSLLLEAESIMALGVNDFRLGNPLAGEQRIMTSLGLYRKAGGSFHVAYATGVLANELFKQGRLEEAVAQYEKSAGIYEEHDNPIGLWGTLFHRSEVQQKMGELSLAHADALLAHTLAARIGLPLYRAKSAGRLASIIAAQGDHVQAYRLLDEAVLINEELHLQKSGERILALAERFQAEEKQRKIDELIERNHRQALSQRWLWTGLGSVGVLLFFISVFLWQIRRSREQIRALNVSLESRVQEQTDELQDQASYLSTLIDTLPDILFEVDRNGRYLNVWSRDPGLLAIPKENLLGMHISDVLSPESAAIAMAAIREADEKGASTAEDLYIDTPRGRRWFSHTLSKKPGNGEREATFVVLSRDVTELKKTEGIREAALEEARRLAAARSRFLAHMSHELRSPLNSILGYAQLLKHDPCLEEKPCSEIGVILESGEHLLTLINDILDFAKSEAGRIELYVSEVSTLRFLQTIAGIMDIKAKKKRIVFVTEFAADLPAWIRVDEKRLRQVLLNLLSNAFKFTRFGQVEFKVEYMPPASLRFSVRDTGIGLDSDQIKTIFQPFEQAGELNQRLGGAGLGLSISRELVRLMGGDIQVDSTPGRGSLFSFEIEIEVCVSRQDVTDTNRTLDQIGTLLRLEWEYDNTENETDESTVFFIPDKDELVALEQLACMGHMQGVIEQANLLAERDSRSRAFCRRLSDLATGYQSRAVLAFIQQHLGNKTR